jgi:glycerol-3-phosphate dehydrogenase (NAD(P)+)
MISKILIIGSGSWGTALASHIAKQDLNNLKISVNLFTKRKELLNEINNFHTNQNSLPNLQIAKNITAIDSYDNNYNFVFIATSSNKIIDTFNEISQKNFSQNCIFVICTKGLISKSSEFISQAFTRIIKNKNLAILSGPNFATEVFLDLPTITTISTVSFNIFEKISILLDSEYFKSIYSPNVEFSELCSVMKNIMAIGCGIIEGLNLGVNAKSALVVKGINEISSLSKALNIDQDFLTPAGFGDIFLTCSSHKSRNFSLGVLLTKNPDNFLDNFQ